MYTDYYLKFADEAEANAVLYTVHPAVVDENGLAVDEYTTPNYMNIDTLGVLYKAPPDPLPDPYVPVPLDGWYVNVRALPGENGEALVPFDVKPQPPIWRRVWA